MKNSLKRITIATLVMVLGTMGTIQLANAAKRDSVNLSVLAILSTVDPHGTRNLQDMNFLKQVYEPLMWQNEITGKFEYRIAESHTISEDGLTYTFKLRKNAKFHNGDTVKASDVVFSLLRVKGKPSGVSFSDAIDNVVAVDEKTVNVILKKKSAAFLTNQTQLAIISEREVKEQGDAFGTKINLAGTGPYYLTYLDRAVKWDCQAFDDYYRGKPAIKTLHYKPITDSSAGLIAFESGELDWYIAPIANWENLKKNTKYNTQMVLANHISYASVNWMHGPLGNDKLRKAIAYAIDKEAMSFATFDGHAAVADFMEKPGVNNGAPSEGPVYSYDPKLARKLVIEAGYEKGVNIGKILCIAGSYYEKMAQVLQANLADVGITSEIQLFENATALDMCRKQQFDITFQGYNYTGDIENLRRFVHSSAVGSYYVKFEGNKFDYKRLDSLLDQGGQELDPVKRKALYKEFNDMLMDTACLLPIFHKPQPYVWAKGLNIPVNYPNYAQVFEWSWKD